MQNRIRILSVFLFGLALVGCVPSWNPFYTEKDLVFDTALVGSWRPAEAGVDSKEAWEFSKNSDKLYRLKQTDDQGRTAIFDAGLFKLNNRMFLDLYLTKIEGDGLKVNDWANASLVPAHLLLSIEQITPSLKMAIMDPEWIQSYLKEHPDSIKHRALTEGIVLTADTGELQKFLLAHMADKKFFGKETEMISK